jgi:uncharacterized GH25 family protein
MRNLLALCCLAALMGLVWAAPASAHEIWATAENPAAGQPLVAVLGYGHHFPEGEAIAEERLPIFFPLEVVNSKGEKLPLKPGDANYKAVTESPVENGTYLILTGYKPTYWSYTPEGSVMKPKNEAQGATGCERYSRSAKGVINIGGAADGFVTKPVGTKLELVPQVNPGQVKVGGELPVLVLYDNQPLKGAEVKGTTEGNKYAEEGNRDFYAKTDNEGKFIFQPIKAGLWTLAVEVRSEYPDKAVCDDEAGDATLTFSIN